MTATSGTGTQPCIACGKEIPIGAIKCPFCGVGGVMGARENQEETVTCSECGGRNPESAEKCIHCGEMFDDEESNDDEDGPPARNLYVEHRMWVYFWGIFVDSETEVNKILKKYNAKGWDCIQIWRQNGIVPNIPVGNLILIAIVTVLTLGFVSYYVGPSYLMVRATKKDSL